ncbi:hypothetical protein FRC00_002886, partial [Tulasnella sp. 408]
MSDQDRFGDEEQTQTVQCNAGTRTITAKAPESAIVCLNKKHSRRPQGSHLDLADERGHQAPRYRGRRRE